VPDDELVAPVSGAPTHVPTARPRLLLGVLLAAAGGYSLLQSLVVPALPALRDELHASSTGVAWVFTAFLLSASVVTPLAGRLGEMLGKKRLLLVVMGLLAAGTLLAALAGSLPLMIAARTIQGFGGAIFPLAFAIIRDELPVERVSGAIALMSAVLGLGGVLGIVLAGPILESLSVHWLFWIPLTVTLAGAAAVAVVVPESPFRTAGQPGWGPALLFSGALVCLLFAVSKAPEWGWTSATTLGTAAASLVLAAAWVAAERRARHPYVDLRVTLLPGTRAANLAAFLVGWGMYAGFVLLPQFVEAPSSTGYGLGLSVTHAGLFLLPWTAGIILASPLSGRLSTRIGSKWPLTIGAAVGTAGFLALLAEHGDAVELCIASGIIGIGVGLAFASLANLVVESVPRAETGAASGVNIVLRTVGGAIGTQAAVSLVAATAPRGGLGTEHGYEAVFAISAAVLALGAAAALRAPGRRRARPAAAPAPARPR
jgi:EmrB/QacA subfamily drug resistance transporter